jgi:hypothetical protein
LTDPTPEATPLEEVLTSARDLVEATQATSMSAWVAQARDSLVQDLAIYDYTQKAAPEIARPTIAIPGVGPIWDALSEVEAAVQASYSPANSKLAKLRGEIEDLATQLEDLARRLS